MWLLNCALEVSSRVGDRYSEGMVSLALARAYEKNKAIEPAAKMYTDAVQAFDALGDQEMSKVANESLQRVSQSK